MLENMNDEPEFTDEQLRAVLKRVGRDARQAAFAAGLPVYIVKGRFLVALYSDGTEKIVEALCQESDAACEHE